MPKGNQYWGVARKCLNLFFRDALYNHYLRTKYGLAKFERYLEIPLDSHVGTELRHSPEGQNANPPLPRWKTVKGLGPADKRFQDVAERIAKREGTERVHLDVVYWRGKLASAKRRAPLPN
jgi:hypothetical protein